ncbi:alpha-L-fucosidase [Schleiferilactobacillus shenzhenensis]|nr:alpha-L-fucosidase [Schleiferilactobacillus shenzhenensis]
MVDTKTDRQDMELTKDASWQMSDFKAYPEYDMLVKQWAWFQDQKIGLLLHWGLYAQAGIVESWQLSDADRWARGKTPFRPNMHQLKSDYWSLAEKFDPVRFDPQVWARLFRTAGIRYAILTTKHHDGFNMFDTQYSKFKVTNPRFPYAAAANADIFGQFANAMREVGIAVGAYYSKADWHHSDYWRPDGKPKTRNADFNPVEDSKRWQRYVDFVHNQLVEITTKYGPLGMLWLDAGWVGDNREPLNLERVITKIRMSQPTMLTVDRTMGGRFENYVTPERQIPKLEKRPALPWESNIPLADNWGYVPHDHYKPFKEVLLSILQVVSLGGNIVLGVGPRPDGRIPQQAVKRLEQLGGWLDLNGEGIFGTRPLSDSILRRAQHLGMAISQSSDMVYVFPLKQRSSAIDLEVLGIANQIGSARRLGTKILYTIKDNVVMLPGSLRQSLFPGIALTKKIAGQIL